MGNTSLTLMRTRKLMSTRNNPFKVLFTAINSLSLSSLYMTVYSDCLTREKTTTSTFIFRQSKLTQLPRRLNSIRRLYESTPTHTQANIYNAFYLPPTTFICKHNEHSEPVQIYHSLQCLTVFDLETIKQN